jgi:hypothetical protein
MENVVELICNGSFEFTPDVLVRLIIFVLVLDCISSIASAVLSVNVR